MQYEYFIDLTAIKKISSDGKYSYLLNFYDDLFKYSRLRLTFFSIIEKERFLREIFTIKTIEKDFLFKKKVLLKYFTKNDKINIARVNELIIYMKKILKRKSYYFYELYYNVEIFDYFNYSSEKVRNKQKENINKNKFSRKFFFIFNSYKLHDSFFKYIFYGIKNVKYKYRDYKALYDDCILRDLEDIKVIEKISENAISVLINKNEEKEILDHFLKKNDFKKKLRKAVSIDLTNKNHNYGDLADNDQSIINNELLFEESRHINREFDGYKENTIIDLNCSAISEDDLSNIKRQRHNVEHKKQKNYVDEFDFNVSKISLDETLNIKSEFEKVSFEVNLCYYFSKEPKILEIYNSGIFTIYKKGKV